MNYDKLIQRWLKVGDRIEKNFTKFENFVKSEAYIKDNPQHTNMDTTRCTNYEVLELLGDTIEALHRLQGLEK